MKAPWIVSAICLVLVAVYLALPGEDVGTHAAEQARHEDQETIPAEANAPLVAKDPRNDRVEIPETLTPKPKADEEPPQELVHVDPFSVRIRAVDKDGESVPGATIRVLQARRVRSRAFPGAPKANEKSRGNTYSGALPGAKPVWEGFTDLGGRRTLELDIEMCLLDVQKEGVGQSGQITIWHSHKRDAEWLITLEPVILLEGVVLRADGSPAAGVNVRILVSGGSVARRSRTTRPAPRKADAEGRFSSPIEPYAIYRVIAYDGKERSHSVSVYTTQPGGELVRKIVVRFPGAISIRGILLDADGAPIAGTVRLYEKMTLEEMRQRDDSPYTKSAKADEEGRFRFDVPRFAKYMVLGSAGKAAPSSLMDVEVTKPRPHADVQVQLTPAAKISGVVRREDGTALPFAWIYISPESGDHSGMSGTPKARDVYGRFAPSSTDADGRFAFENVHPGTKYTLRCRPDPKQREIQIERKGIAAGEELLVIARRNELLTTSISILVRSDRTGEILRDFEVKRLVYRDGGRVGLRREKVDLKPDGRLVLEGLARNKKYGFTVRAKGYALTQVGPIVASKAEHEMEMRLLELGSLLVRVRGADGRPVVNLRVITKKKTRIPSSRFRSPLPSDAEGNSLFPQMDPGDYEVSAFQDGKLSASVKAVVRPGRQTEVTLKLAK